jgi:hypothetical protein
MQCDEKRPTCGSCQRLLLNCNYENRRESSRQTLSHSLSYGEEHITTAIKEIDPLQPLDCELIHHWTKHTAHTFSDDPDRTHVWEVLFPLLAFQQDFLLHTLLATSSLHLACIGKPQHRWKYFAACDKHFNWAIKQYRVEILNLSNRNCEALFACGMLLFLSSFSEQEEDAPINDSPQKLEPTLAQGVRFMREGRALFKPYIPQIMAGCLRPLLAEPDRSTFLSDDPGMLTDFESLCKGADDFHLEAYNQAVASLKIAYASRACGSPLKMVQSWPITLSETFVKLLEAEDARALVILAHYCAVAHASSRCWWARQNQIERQLRRIEEKVGDAWTEWLEWPKYVVSLTVVREDRLRH